MMFNHAGHVFQPSIIEKEKLHNLSRSKRKPAQISIKQFVGVFNEKLGMMYGRDVKVPNNAYLPFRMCLLAQAAVFTMRYFYGSACSYINGTVTSFGKNLHNRVNIGKS